MRPGAVAAAFAVVTLAALGCGDPVVPDEAADASLALVIQAPGAYVPELYRVRPDGSELSKITNPESDGAVSWSPDRRRLAYAHGTRLMIINADGSGAHEVHRDGIILVDAIAWSPDGREILYGGITFQQTYSRIVRIPAGGGSPTILAEGYDLRLVREPTWSPDGRQVAFSRMVDRQWQLYVMNADGSGARQVTRTEHRYGGSADWSPDGSAITFIGFADDAQRIWRISPDGTGFRRMTGVAKGADRSPAWSPDGRRLAFVRWDLPDILGRVHTVAADGTDLREVPAPPGVQRVAW